MEGNRVKGPMNTDRTKAAFCDTMTVSGTPDHLQEYTDLPVLFEWAEKDFERANVKEEYEGEHTSKSRERNS